MERRALLSLLGAGAVTLAGCTDRIPGGDGPDGASPTDSTTTDTDSPTDSTPTDTPATDPDDRRVEMGEAAIVDKAQLRVEDPVVRASVMRDAGAWQSLDAATGQFVVVAVTTAGPVPDRIDDLGLSPAVDGAALSESGPILVAEDGGGGPFDPAEWDRQPLAFPFPAEQPDRAAIQWAYGDTTVRWALDESVRATLGREPRFAVEQLDARRAGGDVELDIAVANEGDRDGRFQAQVSFEAIHDASSVVELEVPAGGTARYRDVPPILEYSGVETVTVRFAASGEYHQVERQVPAERETTTATRSAE